MIKDNSNAAAVAILLRHPAIQLNDGGGEGRSPVYDAFIMGYVDVAELLLEHPGLSVYSFRTAVGSAPQQLHRYGRIVMVAWLQRAVRRALRGRCTEGLPDDKL